MRVHGVGGGGLVIVKVGSAAVDMGRFGRMLVLLLIQREMRVDGVLVGVVMVMRMRRERVGGDVMRRKPVGCQGAGCEAQSQRGEQTDRKPVGNGGRRRGAEVRQMLLQRRVRQRQPRRRLGG